MDDDATRIPSPDDPVTETNAAIVAALALWTLDNSASAEELAERVQALSRGFDTEAAERSLQRLAGLGLVRFASGAGPDATYVRTTLGSEHAAWLLGTNSLVLSRLTELERLRTDFVATIAHELKTPLTAIRTCIGLLMDADAHADEEVQGRLLSRVATSADTMQQLIANLLDLARYRAGGVQLESRWVDALEVARDAAALVAPMMEAQQQEVRFTAPDEPPRVYADRRRLVQALGNIFSNAQKFSPPGSVIEVAIREEDGKALWAIRDSGLGISEEDRRHLFERFFRGRRDTEGGTGLGLPIALAAVQAHGGTIAVESEVGVGSCFTVSIPLAPAQWDAGDDL